MDNIKWAIDINDPSTWESIRPDIKVKPVDIVPILKDDYTKLKDIVSKVEDYFEEIDDIRSMRVEDLLIYVREMVRG